MPGQYPHQVSIRTISNDRHFCGGSIVNERYILTAAHCTIDKIASNIKIVAGTISLAPGHGITYFVEAIKNHEIYIPILLFSDISLIKTDKIIEFSTNVDRIPLSFSYISQVNAVAIGWGSTTIVNCIYCILKYFKQLLIKL